MRRSALSHCSIPGARRVGLALLLLAPLACSDAVSAPRAPGLAGTYRLDIEDGRHVPFCDVGICVLQDVLVLDAQGGVENRVRLSVAATVTGEGPVDTLTTTVPGSWTGSVASVRIQLGGPGEDQGGAVMTGMLGGNTLVLRTTGGRRSSYLRD